MIRKIDRPGSSEQPVARKGAVSAEGADEAGAEAPPVATDTLDGPPAADDGDPDPDREAARDDADGSTPGEADPGDTDPIDADPVDADGAAESAAARPLRYRVEAVLFASGDVVTPARLASVLSQPQDAIRAALAELQAEWAERIGAVDLVEIAGGWRFMTRPTFHDDLAGLARKGGVEKLSPAALETLAIVAYRQPVTRAEIEAVRGVQAGPLLRVLLDRDLIRVSGRSPEPGHPLLYGTTKRFLDHFGLKSLKNLPDLKDLLD